MGAQAFSKKEQVGAWVNGFRQTPTEVLVSDYCYNCLFSGDPKRKTLIVIPEEVDFKGVISIDKPLDEIGLLDIIQVSKRIRSTAI